MEVLKPPRLRSGQWVGLVCPASPPLEDGVVEGSRRYLEARGFRVRLGEAVGQRHGFLAGPDEARAADFNAMIRDPEVRAIMAVRGGYGTPRLLPRIDYAGLRRDPKIVAGFSDITALQFAIFKKCGLITFSGAMPGVDLWRKPDAWTEQLLWDALGSRRKPKAVSAIPLQKGRAEGRLLCGNLSMIVSLLGTPWCPDWRGAILLLEDVGEEPYRVDRMLTQLRNAGVLRRLAGLAFGQFTGGEPKHPERPHFTMEEVLRQAAEWMNGPCVKDVPYGHVPRKLTLPVGARARLDGKTGVLEILEAGVS